MKVDMNSELSAVLNYVRQFSSPLLTPWHYGPWRAFASLLLSINADISESTVNQINMYV
jgi:hypothetical protein